jgi:hypothetical protein
MKTDIKPYFHNKSGILRILICGIIFSLFFNTAEAATITWTGGFLGLRTNWNSSGNWSHASKPGSDVKLPVTVIKADSGNLKMGAPAGQADKQQMFRLKLFIDSLNYDNIAIGFKSTASLKYDLWEDTWYFAGPGASTGFASFSADSVPLAVNFVPLPKHAPLVIKLSVSAIISGRLTIEKTQLDSLAKIYELWLMDKYKKDSLDIRNNSTYAFDIDRNNATTFGDNRFELVIRQNKALGIHLLDFTAAKVSGGVQTTWKVENEESYTNFTVERSTDNGATFIVLGGFASNSQGVYTFMDANPAKTTNIYRTKIEDLNSSISYTKAISITYSPGTHSTANANIYVYPNPARSLINLGFSDHALTKLNLSAVQGLNNGTLPTSANGSYLIKIISVRGTIVKSMISAEPNLKDDVSALLPGTYVVQVLDNKDKSLVGKAAFVKL